jgi:hypothetical protein
MAKGTKKNFTPPLECPHVADQFLHHTAQSSGVMATKLTQFVADVADWKAAVRKHYADGGKASDVPKFPQGKFFNPNTGRMTRAARDKLVDDYNEALDAEKATPPFPPVYNPVEVDALAAMNCGTRIRRGSPKVYNKPPKEWNEKKHGSWYLMDDDGKRTIPSGWFFDTSPLRRPHPVDIVSRVDDPDKNVLTINNVRYVVGTDTVAAPFLVHAHHGGNYGANDKARKEMSTASKKKEIANLVFRIEDKPNEGGAVVIKGDWKDSVEVPFMPGQVLTAGHLLDSNGAELKPGQIRKIVADETKGNGKRLRFKALSEPIVCPAIPYLGKDGLWLRVQAIQGRGETKKQREREGRGEVDNATPRSKSIENARNQHRCDPGELNPFGFKSVALHMVPYLVATGKGSSKDGEFSMGIVIGARSNRKYMVGANEAKRRLAEADDAAPPIESEVVTAAATAK